MSVGIEEVRGETVREWRSVREVLKEGAKKVEIRIARAWDRPLRCE